MVPKQIFSKLGSLIKKILIITC